LVRRAARLTSPSTLAGWGGSRASRGRRRRNRVRGGSERGALRVKGDACNTCCGQSAGASIALEAVGQRSWTASSVHRWSRDREKR
jgi:hypothetical protein